MSLYLDSIVFNVGGRCWARTMKWMRAGCLSILVRQKAQHGRAFGEVVGDIKSSGWLWQLEALIVVKMGQAIPRQSDSFPKRKSNLYEGRYGHAVLRDLGIDLIANFHEVRDKR